MLICVSLLFVFTSHAKPKITAIYDFFQAQGHQQGTSTDPVSLGLVQLVSGLVQGEHSVYNPALCHQPLTSCGQAGLSVLVAMAGLQEAKRKRNACFQSAAHPVVLLIPWSKQALWPSPESEWEDTCKEGNTGQQASLMRWICHSRIMVLTFR